MQDRDKKLTFNVKTETELTTSMVDHFKYGEKVRTLSQLLSTRQQNRNYELCKSQGQTN